MDQLGLLAALPTWVDADHDHVHGHVAAVVVAVAIAVDNCDASLAAGRNCRSPNEVVR